MLHRLESSSVETGFDREAKLVRVQLLRSYEQREIDKVLRPCRRPLGCSVARGGRGELVSDLIDNWIEPVARCGYETVPGRAQRLYDLDTADGWVADDDVDLDRVETLPADRAVERQLLASFDADERASGGQ